MIKMKFVGEDDKKTTIFIGFSDENLRRLREDMPVIVNGVELGMDDLTIVLWSARTDKQLKAEAMELVKKARERG